MSCPWAEGSKRQRFYRADYGRAPDCAGCDGCDGGEHRCHLFGLPGFCEWPPGLALSYWDGAYWWPDRTPGLAETWLPPYDRSAAPTAIEEGRI